MLDWLSEVNTWREIMTVGFFALFLWILLHAYSRKNKDSFEEIGLAVVQDDDTNAQSETPERGR